MTSSNSQMHNDIMAAGSKERPPMLAPSSYAQWKSRLMISISWQLVAFDDKFLSKATKSYCRRNLSEHDS
ncbi:hypothetical protein Tco_0454430 [Tanacetum coccineum]